MPVVETNAAIPPETSPAWFVSLLFWLSLLISAGMYATVALSPKLAEWIKVRQQYARNASHLVQLEGEVEYLERVAAALQKDPEFARRIAQASLPSVPHGREIIPVTRELLFGGVSGDQKPRMQIVQPAFAHVVFRVADDSSHRRSLLAASVLLILFSFTFLNDSENGYVRNVAHAVLWIAHLPLRRYRRLIPLPPSVADAPETDVTSPFYHDKP